MPQAVLELLDRNIFIKDENGTYLYCNGAYASLIGTTPEAVIGKNDHHFFSETIVRKHHLASARVFRGEQSVSILSDIPLNGRHRLIETVFRPLALSDGTNAVAGTFTDITDLYGIQNSLELAGKVFQYVHDAILITDEKKKIIQINDAFSKISGYSFDEIKGKDPSFLSSGWHEKKFYESMWEAINRDGRWEGEIWDRRKNGELYIAELTVTAVKNDFGVVENYISISNDITERKEKESVIHNLAYYDSLTQLPNRAHFKQRIEERIASAKKSRKRLGIIFFDLDNFKHVNDTMGHLTGDLLLKAVAEKIGPLIREDDCLSRLGGDEFTILIDHLETPGEIRAIANKIISLFKLPFVINDKEVFSGTSIGISIYPDDGHDYDSLIKAADTAMYHVKERGKNSFKFFTPEMNADVMERVSMEYDLRSAILNNELYVEYQPKIETRTNTVYGMEALVRWKHPRLGMISPEKFIAIAEESGQIYSIGLWVAECACNDTKALHDSGFDHLVVSINISNIQLKKDDFIDDLLQIIESSGIKKECVELEITENCLMRNVDTISTKLSRLNEENIQLAIDDFGTGHSSLSYLKKLPVQTLKIDKRFILEIDTDADNKTIAMAVIALAKSLGIDVVAEGSETQSHIDTLTELDCHRVQGYFYSKPMPLRLFERYLIKG